VLDSFFLITLYFQHRKLSAVALDWDRRLLPNRVVLVLIYVLPAVKWGFEVLSMIPEVQVSFEKARFEYCARMYQAEVDRKEILERKSQFFLSLIIVFLGAIFLRLDFIESLGNSVLRYTTTPTVGVIFYSATIALALSLLTALIGILAAIQLQKYKDEYPHNFISSLFSPDTGYLADRTEAGLFEAGAMSYAIALELNRELNNQWC
jgi:hypothetical protein